MFLYRDVVEVVEDHGHPETRRQPGETGKILYTFNFCENEMWCVEFSTKHEITGRYTRYFKTDEIRFHKKRTIEEWL